MCGIAGILFKHQEQLVGEVLIKMLADLNRRGFDSTGVALYGTPSEGNMVVRVKVEEDAAEEAVPWEETVRAAAQRLGEVKQSSRVGYYVRLAMEYSGEYEKLARSIEACGPGVEVFSMGQHLEIIKQMGYAQPMDSLYDISAFRGSHGIGHTRMATESRVDISHSHPFWARPFPDISVVHNGHITNYYKLRRRLEIKGHHFSTGNDSEVIAVYIADMMQEGATLNEAITSTVAVLDGSFTYLVATADSIGYARDQFGTKPLIVAETDEFVAVASEEAALRQAFPYELDTREAGACEVRTWRLVHSASPSDVVYAS